MKTKTKRSLRDQLRTTLKKAENFSYASPPLTLLETLDREDFETWAAGSDELHKLSKKLVEAVKADPRFPGDEVRMINTGHMPVGFYPNFVSPILLRKAIEMGSADAAIAWLERLMHCQSASGKLYQTLWGAPVTEAIDLTSNVRLVPLSVVPDRAHKRKLTSRQYSFRGSLTGSLFEATPFSSAIVVTETISPLLHDPATKINHAKRHAVLDCLHDISLVLSLVGPRVVVPGVRWFEFDDSDFNVHMVSESKVIEVVPLSMSEHGPLDPVETKELVAAFLALPSGTKNVLRTAIERIGQAGRRHGIGDKAVELCTAFECLVGDKKTTEMTHKVRVRSTRVLGGDDAVRLRNYIIIGTTYDVRSKLVHTGESNHKGTRKIDGKDVPIPQIVDSAFTLCTEVVKTFIRRGEVPDWQNFDISENPI